MRKAEAQLSLTKLPETQQIGYVQEKVDATEVRLRKFWRCRFFRPTRAM